MINKNISKEIQQIMVKIGKAVEKGVGEDIRNYLSSTHNVTNNAVVFMRGDRINTNLVNSVQSDTVDIRYFTRSAWKGCIVIDRKNKLTFSIASKNTIERIPKKKNRHCPHFLQTLLNTENMNESAEVKQISMSDLDPSFSDKFSQKEYEEDFDKIMDDAISLSEEYRHWVVEYEVKHNILINLVAKLLDRDFDVVQKIELMEMLKPNFGDLTAVELEEIEVKNVHDLVSIKEGIKGRRSSEQGKQTEILPKVKEGSKEA